MGFAEQIEQLRALGNTAQALAMLEQWERQDSGEACMIRGRWHVAGVDVPRDFNQARLCFEQALARGCTAAREPLIALLAYGPGNCERNWGEALRLLQASAVQEADAAARQVELLASMRLDEDGNPQQVYQPEFLSSDPLVVQFSAFLTEAECNALIDMAEAKLAPAQVVHPVTGRLISDPVRTSLSASFPILEETPFLSAVNRRIAAASRSNALQGEPTQILAYHPGQQYHLHSDALAGESNQRIQTFLIYLTDDFEGGATYFPQGHLSLRPARGDAICFSNVDAQMRPAASARHAGLPVTSGTKIVLSKWIRRSPLNLQTLPKHR